MFFSFLKNLKLLQRGNGANTFCSSCRGKFRYIIKFTLNDNLEWLVAICHWDFSTNPVVSNISRHICLSLKWSVCGGTHIHNQSIDMLTIHMIEHSYSTRSFENWAPQSGTVTKPIKRGLYVQIVTYKRKKKIQ